MKCTIHGTERIGGNYEQRRINDLHKRRISGCIDKHWNWNLLENIIDYGIENKIILLNSL